MTDELSPSNASKLAGVDGVIQPMETPSGDERAFSRLQEGLLVLADISGYTALVAQTEIDHSWEILHELLDSNTFVSFHRRLRDMRSVTTCPCNACASIGMLKLKFVVHRGSFSRQRLGTVEQLHGTDAIVATAY